MGKDKPAATGLVGQVLERREGIAGHVGLRLALVAGHIEMAKLNTSLNEAPKQASGNLTLSQAIYGHGVAKQGQLAVMQVEIVGQGGMVGSFVPSADLVKLVTSPLECLGHRGILNGLVIGDDGLRTGASELVDGVASVVGAEGGSNRLGGIGIILMRVGVGVVASCG